MASKKTKQKLMKRRICSIARVFACASFLILTIIGVSSLVRAMSLETIANENGIPASWKAASLGNPETITIPITYWDQRQDDCNDPNRQFEWTECRLYAKGIIRGVVRNRLGADGLPVPTYTNSTDAWAAYHDVFTANVTGNNPVQSTDNFYRWFHESYDINGKQLSKRYNREVTFHRNGNNSYEYGSKGTFPLDNVDFSKNDSATKTGHNFHFTAHMRIPMKISADGTEQFWFSGDDDVWVFLNGQLVLDLGGLHMDTEGNFTINASGNVVSTVNNVADQSCRQSLPNPLTVGYDIYNNRLENSCPRKPVTTTIYTNFKPGDVVNLDFFYAERSTSESNTRINIANMNWPISADSDVKGEVVGQIEDTDNKLVQFNTSITNRDPENQLKLERFAAYINETAENKTNQGFIPLTSSTLYYTTTPEDKDSWKPVEISTPSSSATGFNLSTPLIMSPAGSTGDTIYFRYFAETSGHTGSMTSTVSYYTTLGGVAGVTYDYDTVTYEKPPVPEYTVTINYLYKEDNSPAAEPYTGTLAAGSEFSIDSPEIDGFTPDYAKISGTVPENDIIYNVYYTKNTPEVPVDPTPPQPEEPEPTPIEPEDPDTPVLPILPNLPGSDIIDGDLTYLGPLGEIAYVPNTGIISDAVAAVFEVGFAEVILSQGFVMIVLLIFAGSFATWFSLRKYLDINLATRTTSKKAAKNHPKMMTTKAKINPRNARNAHAMHNTKSTKRTKK